MTDEERHCRKVASDWFDVASSGDDEDWFAHDELADLLLRERAALRAESAARVATLEQSLAAAQLAEVAEVAAVAALREVAEAAKGYIGAVSACALDQSLPLCHVDGAFDAQVDALARLDALSSLRSEGSPDTKEEKDGQ